MSRADRIALLISLIAVLAAYYVTERYYDAIPHLEDEIAYVWQAEAIAGGKLTLPTPPERHSFLVPFVVDYDGQRFGKYPLGWPVLLAIGVRFGIRSLVNPLLAGLGVWLTYRLGKKLMGETVGIIAAVLTVTSPFFLLNSGSLLSHPFGMVLSAAFALAWVDGFGERTGPRQWLPTLTAGLTLGLLALTRPFTAAAIAFPFLFHGVYLLVRGDRDTRKHVLAVGGLVVGVGALNLLWQYAVTGDPFLNPYTLWWPYDKIGFGPGIGRAELGHNLHLARNNTRFNLQVGYSDLFGWVRYSWIFLPFGLLAAALRRNWRAIMVATVFPTLVVFHLAYWVGAWLYGPRYYYEGLFSLTILSGAGIAWLAGWNLVPGQAASRDADPPPKSGWRRWRPLLVFGLVTALVLTNLVFYTPQRLEVMRGLYGMERADLEPFLSESAQEMAPALIVVHPKVWMDYGVLLELSNPYLDTPFIFVYSRGVKADDLVIGAFPERSAYHYYPEEPETFYTSPK
jgi:4-amino-4-deoxy-L-arabinose transferase-like glycosyltransferase